MDLKSSYNYIDLHRSILQKIGGYPIFAVNYLLAQLKHTSAS